MTDFATTPERDLANLTESLLIVIQQAQHAVDILDLNDGKKPAGENLRHFTNHVIAAAETAADLETLHARVRSR